MSIILPTRSMISGMCSVTRGSMVGRLTPMAAMSSLYSLIYLSATSSAVVFVCIALLMILSSTSVKFRAYVTS